MFLGKVVSFKTFDGIQDDQNIPTNNYLWLLAVFIIFLIFFPRFIWELIWGEIGLIYFARESVNRGFHFEPNFNGIWNKKYFRYLPEVQ